MDFRLGSGHNETLWSKGTEAVDANHNEMTAQSGREQNYPTETESPEKIKEFE